jgi:bis(5'-nucleosyl)-tetraphosphatase (symmetrical)
VEGAVMRFFSWLNRLFGWRKERIWAIGDIQGCFDDFQALLHTIEFDPRYDRLWIAGDLVNRGGGSLETLEYLYSIRDRIQVVLGNHDLTLIAAYYGFKKSNETIDPILQSPRVDELIGWLRQQPFLHCDAELGYCMAHAGISPMFSLEQAQGYARRIEAKLQSDGAKGWLKKMYQKGSGVFDPKADEITLDRYIVNSFTRMRFCDNSNGVLEFDQKGMPTKKLKKQGLVPWYKCDVRRPWPYRIVFGHWSTLGYVENKKVIGLDTGCVWQGKMTAKLLGGDGRIVQVECPDGLAIGDDE